jgi:hypothetical protein
MGKYLYILRIRIISQLAYGIDVVFPLILNFIWIITMTSIILPPLHFPP